MAASSLSRLLDQLEQLRSSFHAGDDHRVLRLLAQLGRRRFRDAESLIRFHEALLFFRAFPPSAAVVRETERLLRGFAERVEQLPHVGADLDDIDTFEASGIAGTTMQDTLSFDVVRWLTRHIPGAAEIAWDDYDDERGMGPVWPLLMPLQAEDSYVEANIPWRRWLEAAVPRGKGELEWIVEQIERLRADYLERARIYDLLRLPVRWKMGNERFSRTLNWSRPRDVFYHREPLIVRSGVSLAQELARRPPVLHKVSRADGLETMDRIREIMLVRYRELYGTTLGDPNSVVRAEIGRGAVIHLWNLPPERRLPLRAYVAGFTLKNGVPINYIEAIGLCEWMEVGFNTFYTFRGGEVAWIFAQVLCCLCHLMGTTCVSMYPYQLGDQNDEAIESGAYWFYRKLGFRPPRKELVELVEREERKIAADKGYRTPARVLRKLASAHLIYELPGSEVGAWDRFSTRNLGLAANRRMAGESRGSHSAGIRRAAPKGALAFDASTASLKRCSDTNLRLLASQHSTALARMLGVDPARWPALEQCALADFAAALGSAAEVSTWSAAEKHALVEIIRAKPARDEMRYLHLTQQHARLRDLLLRLGS
jgi:hypothetical protein